MRAHTGAHTYAHTIAMLVSNASRLGEAGAHAILTSIHTHTLPPPLVRRVLGGSCHDIPSTSPITNFRRNARFQPLTPKYNVERRLGAIRKFHTVSRDTFWLNIVSGGEGGV